MNPLLLQHLSGESIGRFPVWLMRQAGRYLPEYRAVREKHSFWGMVTTPEVAAEISLQPLRFLGVDAVIFFSDILTLPYGMGIEVEMRESVGPIVKTPMVTEEAYRAFLDFDPERQTAFVGNTLEMIRKQLPLEKALIGFAGGPWTVSTYLASEGGRKLERNSLGVWAVREPNAVKEALRSLFAATLRYSIFQTEHGAHLIQLFDTWLSEMPRSFYIEYYRPLLTEYFLELRKRKIPSIYFAKHAAHLTADLAELPCDVLSVDNLLSLSEYEKRTGGAKSLQGNLDPLTLLASEATVRHQTRLLVQEARSLKRPAILNLGHGVLPPTPPGNVKAFVEEAQALWV